MPPGARRRTVRVALLPAWVLSALMATGPAAAETSTTPLVASGQFVTWTWFGTGAPCSEGSNLTFVAHFNGTAAGGTPPYRFSWNFGDGTNSTNLENPTHVYRSVSQPWTAVLTATDAVGASNATAVQVSPAIFHCPAELFPQHAYPGAASGLVDLAVVGIVAAGAAGLYIVARRRDRPGG